jgi:hypothetical protein
MRCTPRTPARSSARSRIFQLLLVVTIAAALALAVFPTPALAQHGGGGHGGGGGGGGSHFSGGSSGGGSHFGSAPSSGGSHPAPPPASHPSPPAPNAFVHPPSSFVGANALRNNALAARPPAWSTFAMPGANAAVSAPLLHSTIGFPPSNQPGVADSVHWQPVTTAHGGGPLSFSGEGHDIWQDPPRASAPSAATNAPSAISPQRPRVFPPGHLPRRPITIGGGGFYPGYYFYNPLFFGLGFGAYCDPLFWNAWNLNCPYFGYSSGYYGNYGAYSSGDTYVTSPDTDNGGSSPDYNIYTPSVSGDENLSTLSNAAPSVVVLYLNDGTTLPVADYWVADYKLHYITPNGGENAMDLDQLDVQRTVDMNATRGVSFTLKPAPQSQSQPGAAPQSTPNAAPQAQPNPAPESTPAPPQ